MFIINFRERKKQYFDSELQKYQNYLKMTGQYLTTLQVKVKIK